MWLKELKITRNVAVIVALILAGILSLNPLKSMVLEGVFTEWK